MTFRAPKLFDFSIFHLEGILHTCRDNSQICFQRSFPFFVHRARAAASIFIFSISVFSFFSALQTYTAWSIYLSISNEIQSVDAKKDEHKTDKIFSEPRYTHILSSPESDGLVSSDEDEIFFAARKSSRILFWQRKHKTLR